MFGYVRAYKPELKCSEYDIYKGVYCSLCKQLGRSYSPFAQMTLSYDLSFLSLFIMSVSDECTPFKNSHCLYNPTVRCLNCKKKNKAVMFSADTAIIMLYYKIIDGIRDSSFFKKIFYILYFIPAYFMFLKAKRKQPQVESVVKTAMKNQSNIERKDNVSVDEAAHNTAKSLSEIFLIGCGDNKQRDKIERIGYLLGRYVYLIDAADDLEDDIKYNNFNPFRQINSSEAKKRMKECLNLTIGEITQCFESLETKRFGNILRNIFYNGLHNSVQTILNE